MAVFQSEPGEPDPATIARLPHGSFALGLLLFGPVLLYRSRDVLNSAMASLQAEGFAIHPMNTSNWTDSESAHEALQNSLEFPDYYGRNLDALNDALSDVRIEDRGGLVLALEGFDGLWRRDSSFAAGLLDVFATASRRLQLFGKTLIVLLRVDDPDPDFGSLGATVACWNQIEFQRANRTS
jgi:hypothetical protein